MTVRAILLDIEGTTTPIDFVHKTLFPYARTRIGKYVRDHFDTLQETIDQLEAERLRQPAFSTAADMGSPESVAKFLEHLSDLDRKSTPLKAIQGQIWKNGYESGELRSAVFDDVPRALEYWHSTGKMIAIYSSGSVLAQKMLFKHTDHGDLTRFIHDYFDTTTGAKRDPASYAKIGSALGLAAGDILFVSDIMAELDAAADSGLQTVLSVRAGNAPVSYSERHTAIRSFDELMP